MMLNKEREREREGGQGRYEELKEKAKQQGLWNLFLPLDSDRDVKFGEVVNREKERQRQGERMGKVLRGAEGEGQTAGAVESVYAARLGQRRQVR
jgi:hypothetical protein